MNKNQNNYQTYIAEIEEKNKKKKVLHTIYLSRRAIWANVLISFLLAPLASYIHTRRWKQMGIFTLLFMVFFMIIPSDSDSFMDSVRKGQRFSLLASLIATIDNSIAIKKARKITYNKES